MSEPCAAMFGQDARRTVPRRAFPWVVRPRVPACRSSTIAAVGACAYCVGFVLPIDRDFPLLVLAAAGCLAILIRGSALRRRSSPLVPLLVGLFLASTVVSVVVSDEWQRGVQFSLPLLPGVLLFLLTACYFDSTRNLVALYGSICTAGLTLAAALMFTVWKVPEADPATLVSSLGSPALIVPNDSIFLAVVAPLALAVLYRLPRWTARLLAALVVLPAVAMVCVLQSRGAAIAVVGSLTCMGLLLSPRRGLLAGLASVTLVLVVDGARGFPLLAKFGDLTEARFALWLAALAMARDAPFLGHGPGAFGVLHESYASMLGLSTWLPVDVRVVPWAHNLYLETLAEQGAVGLSALLALLGGGIVVAWRVYRAAIGEVRTLAAGTLASLLSLCGAALFELSFVRQWVVVLTFTLLGAVAQLSSTLPTPTPEDH